MNENENEMIEEMANILKNQCDNAPFDYCYGCDCDECRARVLTNAKYRKVGEDEIVIKKSEYEKIKSLYDTQKGAIMTSSIGDLPLTIEGLRKSVDEMARARNAEGEAQELCEKYYNEAKDLRRELKKAKQETVREILQEIVNAWNKGEYMPLKLAFLSTKHGIKLE